MEVKSVTRRQLLERSANGFGWLAASALLSAESASSTQTVAAAEGAEPKPWIESATPRAKHVIFCYMSGGVSQVDSFDPKPRLNRDHGRPFPLKMERTQFDDNGQIMGSPWKFRPYGESGIPVSDLFPEIGKCADDLTVIRSMTAQFSEHAQGNFFMHTGFPFLGHPSAGAWTTYGLGNLNEDLPGYVVLQSGGASPPHGGQGLFGSGFLPAAHQASLLNLDGSEPIRNIQPRNLDAVQRAQLAYLQQAGEPFVQSTVDRRELEAVLSNYELAYRMQSAVPDLTDLSDETPETLQLYGVDAADAAKAAYARQCLVARRLVERGVRFIELSCLAYNIGGGNAANPWDHHGELENGHQRMAAQVDQPIAALLQDLKRRGHLDRTLVIWAGEFGRTPFSQGSNGRDHDPFGFSVWLAGGGVRGGHIWGATDEFGYRAIEQVCTVYDLWATVLHQLGINHRRLTFRHGGRDYRLTDVHGNVLRDILA